MHQAIYEETWPESWKLSYFYDELEIGNSQRDLGYKYQYENRHQWSLKSIGERVPEGGAILDVAGASGNFTLPLAEKGYCVTWNDLRSELADFVQLKYDAGSVEFAAGNIFELSQNWPERFDAILAAEVIEHVAHPDEFLVCLASMLKPDGRLFLTTPNGKYFRNHHPRFTECADPSIFESAQFKPNSDGHIFLLDREECGMLAFRAGLAVEEVTLMTNPLTCGHIKLSHLLPHLSPGTIRSLESRTRTLPQFLQERIHAQMAVILRKR